MSCRFSRAASTVMARSTSSTELRSAGSAKVSPGSTAPVVVRSSISGRIQVSKNAKMPMGTATRKTSCKEAV